MRNLVLTVFGLLFSGAAIAAPAQYSYSQCTDIVYVSAGAKAKEAQETCQERRETDYIDCLANEYSNMKSFRTFQSNKAICASRYSNGPTKEEMLCAMRLESVGFNQAWGLSLCKWTTRNSIQNCIVINAANTRTDVQRDAVVRSCYNQDAVGELTETGVNRVELEKKRKAAEAEARRQAEEQRRQEEMRRQEQQRRQAEEQRRQEEMRRQEQQRRQAEEQRRQDEIRREQERREQERNNRPTPPPAPGAKYPTPPAPPAPAKPVVTQDSSKSDSQKTETPKSEAPRTETPRTETPRTETPRTETPKAPPAPKTETPKAEPKKETPKTEAPKSAIPVEDRSTPAPAKPVPGPIPSGTENDSAKTQPEAVKAQPAESQQPSQSTGATTDDTKDKEPAKDNSGATPATENGVIVDLPLFE